VFSRTASLVAYLMAGVGSTCELGQRSALRGDRIAPEVVTIKYTGKNHDSL